MFHFNCISGKFRCVFIYNIGQQQLNFILWIVDGRILVFLEDLDNRLLSKMFMDAYLKIVLEIE